MTEGWTPESYLDEIRSEVPLYDELQERVVDATRDLCVRCALELGVGTGETARRIHGAHPSAMIIGIDGSEVMLAAARVRLSGDNVDLRLARLEDPLPAGKFDPVVSVLAVHHLASDAKAALFGRIASALGPGGRFVLGDVVIPERPVDSIIPIEEGFDCPDRLEDQLLWLREVGLSPAVEWSRRDLAVVSADRQPSP